MRKEVADKLQGMYNYLKEKGLPAGKVGIVHNSSGYIVYIMDSEKEKVTDEIKEYIESKGCNLVII